MEDLCAFVKENNADIGFAFDGDADRCLAVDENGEIIDGDRILAICELDMKKKGTLKNDTLVGTVMTNLGLIKAGKENGIKVYQTAVGDRYVIERMLQKGYNLGGEQSGHIIFLDHNTTGDGVLSAIQVLTVLKESGKKASEPASVMQVMPQVHLNARVRNENKDKYLEDIVIKKAIDDLTEKYENDGRVLIRTSGTEPLIRVMIEGTDTKKMEKDAEELKNLIEQRLQ